MASLFIYLLYAQPHTRPTAAAAAAAALTVAACKWAGAAGIAVPVAALAGVAAGLAAGALPRAPHAPRRAHQQASRDHGYGSASAHGREGRPPMTQSQFLILWLTSFAFILACRVLPALALRGRPLSPRATEALGYIPPAAFAALVANDLLPPPCSIRASGRASCPSSPPESSCSWHGARAPCCGAASLASQHTYCSRSSSSADHASTTSVTSAEPQTMSGLLAADT